MGKNIFIAGAKGQLEQDIRECITKFEMKA